jgi:hypothetical protein
MSTGLSFGKRAKISSIDLYLAISRAVEEDGTITTLLDAKIALRDGETKPDDSEGKSKKLTRETIAKAFIVMNDGYNAEETRSRGAGRQDKQGEPNDDFQ